MEYASDGFCPDDFHLWTGLSIIAGALERRVWLKQSLVVHHPNLYVLLVSHPGVGKSTALDRGVGLLEDLKTTVNPNFKIIPNQITEPALIDMMKILQEISVGSAVFRYSSGYFHASEASASALQNLCGDFNATITSLYDCPKMFRKKLKSDQHATEIPNACFNVLAGATFDYLKKLVNEESVMGGLASRFIYVIAKERKIRASKWGDVVSVDSKLQKLLMQDLLNINRMQGPFKPTEEYKKKWEEYQPEFDKFLIALNSPRMESIMARKFTNITKISMLLSASEGSTMTLTADHWDRAVSLVESVVKDNAFVISSAIMADKHSQAGLNQKILDTIEKFGGECKIEQIKNELIKNGNDVSKIDATIRMLAEANNIENVNSGGRKTIRLLVDPNGNL